jgi:acetyltransferase
MTLQGRGDRFGTFRAGDPIRGLALMAVFTAHAAVLSVAYSRYPEVLGPTHFDTVRAYGEVAGTMVKALTPGLLVFFVLSGYLIGRPFARALVVGVPMPNVLRFLRNRVLRIVPAYVVAVAVVVVLVLAVPLPGEPALRAHDVLALLAFDIEVTNPLSGYLGQAWSLEVEWKFYLLLPALAVALAALFRLRPRLSPAVRAAVLLALLACVFVLSATAKPDPGVLSFAVMMGGFVPGVALAVVEPLVAPRVRGARAAPLVATVAAVVGLAWMLVIEPLFGTVAAFSTLDRWAAGLVVGGALALEWSGRRPWRVLDNRATQWLGARSYSVYLLHLMVIRETAHLVSLVFPGYKMTLLFTWPLALVASLALGHLLFTAVERPFLERRRATAQRRAASGAEVPAQPAAPGVLAQ